MGSSKRRTRERVAQMRAEQQRQQRRSRIRWAIATAVVGVVAIGMIAAAIVVGGGGGDGTRIAGVRTFEVPRGHVTGNPEYDQTPPAGGKHNPVWQNCGAYDSPVRNRHAVHSLEHGAVWITYQPDLPKEQLGQLRDLVRGRQFVLLSPYPGLPSPVVASAWGKQLRVDSAGDQRLEQFLRAYVQGPQTPEPNAACRGGIGTPISS